MKKLVLFVLTIITSSVYSQNYVTIPDANFAKYLKEVVPNAINGDQLDTSSADVKNLKKIDAEARAIKNLDGVQYFTGLDTLDVGNDEYVNSDKLNEFQTLLNFPSNLKVLICGYTSLDSLDNLPNSLIEIKCYKNELKQLPVLPINLKKADFSQNNIDSINLDLNYLEMDYLNLYANKINFIKNFPNKLIELNIATNRLSKIPLLSNQIEVIDISQNHFSTLPDLPNSLIKLYANNCELTEIKKLPAYLLKLEVYNNLITTLENLPNSIDYINCSQNKIKQLKNLPLNLSGLICYDNLINFIEYFPSNLTFIACQNNNLKYLPELPKKLSTLYAGRNPIFCLPILPTTLQGLDIDYDSISCLPNYLPIMSGIVKAIPLCDVNGKNNNHFCDCGKKGITGSIFFDENNNCKKDYLEEPIFYVKVILLDKNNNQIAITYTDHDGYYQFVADSAEYIVKIETKNTAFDVNCRKILDTLIIVNSKNIFVENIDFLLINKPGFDLAVNSINHAGIVFPNQEHDVFISAGDFSSSLNRKLNGKMSANLEILISGPVKYKKQLEGSLIPFSVSGNTIKYKIDDISNIDIYKSFSFTLLTDSTAKDNESVCISATISPSQSDYNITNNFYDYCYSVINSHDPNLKEVYPAYFKPGYDGYLTYTVHFQNTGSAQAFNIRLVDTLDAKLDLKTFEVLNYSHANTVSLTGNVMRVKYPNIMLSDSTTNEKASHGFIQYRIKPLAPISEEHQIKNTAYIYFDYNEAVVTNTTISKTNKSLGIHEEKELGLRVYPNPTENLLNFERTSYTINTVNVSIVSVNGQVLFTNSLELSNKQTVDLTNFAPGVYFVNLQNEEVTDVIKVIKK